MNSANLLVLGVSVIFTGYLSFGTSQDTTSDTIPKLWPNISDSGSFLKFPSISGSGGLNFSFYDAFVNAINKTRNFPNMLVRHGNFTLLQLALLKAVGGLAAGAATVAIEGFLLKKSHNQDIHMAHDHHAESYGSPPSSSYGSPPSSSYGSPPSSPPSSNYGAQPPSAPPSSNYRAPPPSNNYGL